MHTNLTFMVAQQHVEDLRRAADRDRLARRLMSSSRRTPGSKAGRRSISIGTWARSLRHVPMAPLPPR